MTKTPLFIVCLLIACVAFLDTTHASALRTEVHTGYSKYLNDGPGGFGLGTRVAYPLWQNVHALLHLGWHQGSHTEKSEPNAFFSTDYESSTSALPMILGASYRFPHELVSPFMHLGLGGVILNTDIKLNGSSLKDNPLFEGSAFKDNELNLALELGGGADYHIAKNFSLGLLLNYTRIFTEPQSLEVLSIHGNVSYVFN